MGMRSFLAKDFVLVWLALVVMGLWLRPLTPVDETRAVSVAWEMWQGHEFLVPHLNGEPYSHKPPLLQWCIHILWLLFGVSDWSARLAAPLFSLGNLYLTAALARRLWPQEAAIERLAPWLLLALPVWAVWSSLTLYDMPVTFCTLLGMLGVARAAAGLERWTWSLLAAAIGGGIVAKGPVILLLALPTALFAPWWMPVRPEAGWGGWYRRTGGAVAVGALLGLAWAVPAGLAGGDEYRRLIFWGQSAGRIANSFAHKRPLWWYLELLPVMLFPWFWWPPLWRKLRRMTPDPGQRFCLVQMLFVLAVFSLISGKQVHYLLPAFPAVALLFASRLVRPAAAPSRWERLPVGSVVTLAGLALLVLPLTPFSGGDGAVQMALKVPLFFKLAVFASGLAVIFWRFDGPFAAARGVTLAMLAVLLSAHLGYREHGMALYDMRPFAAKLAELQAAGAPVAHWSKYNGEFNFLGRLARPIRDVESLPELQEWLKAHPDGYLILKSRSQKPVGDGVVFVQAYKGTRRVELWRAAAAGDTLRRGAKLVE
jgi:4-amino-4-deoxy-L-arabinose transferase-like glycosyltransferase